MLAEEVAVHLKVGEFRAKGDFRKRDRDPKFMAVCGERPASHPQRTKKQLVETRLHQRSTNYDLQRQQCREVAMTAHTPHALPAEALKSRASLTDIQRFHLNSFRTSTRTKVGYPRFARFVRLSGDGADFSLIGVAI